jgi:hypothetical protein
MNTEPKNWGGKRENSGRKPLPDIVKKKTSVIRIDAELLPLVEKLKQGLPITQNQVWQQTSALSEDDLKEQANCIERLMTDKAQLSGQVQQLEKQLQKIKIDDCLQAELEKYKAANESLVFKRDSEYLRANKLENELRNSKNSLENLKARIEKSEAESLNLAGKLVAAESELQEQGKLVMKLIREKKTLEVNLGLKKPTQKSDSVPYNPTKASPVKVNPVNLQGIGGATAKNAKVTLVIDPATIPRVDSTGKKQTALKIAVDAMTFQADLNSKSYRKAIAAIDELGVENCTAILQGSMKEQGKLEGVGLVIQAKKAKEEPSEPVIE